MLEEHIDDYWNVDGDRIVRCMDRIHKICSAKGKDTGRIHMMWEDTYKETKNFLVLMMYGQICGHSCPMQRRRKKHTGGLSRNQSSTLPDN